MVLLAALAAACGQKAGTAEAPPAATVAALPLKPGYYVASDIPCAEASNATTMLVTRTGINGSRTFCRFTQIEKTGATTYRATSECSDGGEAWGHEETVDTSTSIYEIPDETRFRVTYEGGSDFEARFCEQSTMAPGFRDNDISGLIG